MMSGLTKKRISDLEIERSELQRQLGDRPSLRDQFAMAALNGLLQDRDMHGKVETLPKIAYIYADAMLAARNESTEN